MLNQPPKKTLIYKKGETTLQNKKPTVQIFQTSAYKYGLLVDLFIVTFCYKS